MRHCALGTYKARNSIRRTSECTGGEFATTDNCIADINTVLPELINTKNI
jgi:hypothetical protein